MNYSTSQSHLRESYIDYFDPRFPKSLFVLLIIVGISGNLLSLFVFSSSTMKNNSIFTYLAYLSVVDLLVVVLGLGDIALISYFGFVVRDFSLLVCRAHTFATYFFTHLSSFILASVSLDRAIALNLSNCARFYCLPRTAHVVVGVDAIVVFAINAHTLVFLGTYEDNVESSTNSTILHLSCSSKHGSSYDQFLEPYFEWIDLMSYAIVPFVVMVVCTFFIVKVVFRSYNSSKRLSNVSFENNDMNNVNNGQVVTGLMTTDPLTKKASKTSISTIKSKHGNRKKNISYTLISLNILFFSLVSPLLFLLLFLSGIENVREYKFFINIVYILAYANHCLNFIFYGLSSPPYRKAVRLILNIK